MAETEDAFRYTPERRQRLVRHISEQGYCTTAELSRVFGVSEMTIRRDVSKLVEQGDVRGFRGGAGSLTRLDLVGSDYRLRDLRMGAAKEAIARAALQLIGVNSIIALDTLVSPARVLPCQLLHQRADLVRDRRPSLRVRVSPLLHDQPPVPGQQSGTASKPNRHFKRR